MKDSNKKIQQSDKVSKLTQWLAMLLMKLTGWKKNINLPDAKKFILIGAPHTSNWDAFFLIIAAMSTGIRIHWVTKSSLFKFPFRWILRFLGGVPVDRSVSGLTDAIINFIKKQERIIIMIAPEGTRKKCTHWRSGFYFIAKKLNIPIVCGFLDYKTKIAGLENFIYPSDSIKKDMDIIRKFYKPIAAKYPDLVSNIYLQQEKNDE